MRYNMTGSIVVYNLVFEEVSECIDSFLKNGGSSIVVIDSKSPNQDSFLKLKTAYQNNSAVHFIAMDKNYGFGTGHNRGFEYLKNNNLLQEFHSILNPDLIIQENAIKNATEFLQSDKSIAILSPMIQSLNGDIQYLNKEFPNIFDMFIRRFLPKFILNLKYFTNRYNKYTRMHIGYDKICQVPFASGACLFMRSEIFEKLKGFDEKFFLYMEDADFSKRAWEFGTVVYNPNIKVYHHWRRESAKSLKMTLVMIKSMVTYFNKHKWLLF